MTIEVKYFVQGGPASGIQMSGLGDGTFDHIGFYGASDIGPDTDVDMGSAQDITWVIDDAGVARKGGTAESGQMNNNKWIDASGLSLNSGTRTALPVTESGFATLRIEVSDTGNFEIQNAKLYAYDGSNVNTDPPNLWVLSAEIIPPDFSGTGDTEWALIDATNYNFMVDRTTTVGYSAATAFNYYIALSVRPKLTSTAGAKSFGLYFSFDTV